MAGSLQPSYAEVDVTDWTLVGDEVLGTKPKRWVAHPGSAERWLLKDATYSRRADGTSYRKGDDWAGRIAAGVAERMRIPAAQIELATYMRGDETRLGVISKSVLEQGESLLHGNELLREPVVDRTAPATPSKRYVRTSGTCGRPRLPATRSRRGTCLPAICSSMPSSAIPTATKRTGRSYVAATFGGSPRPSITRRASDSC